MSDKEIIDGKYRLLGLLGKGGMGTVFLAENIRLGTMWAIKRLEKDKNEGNLPIEPTILKKLNHPSLPRVFDIIEDTEFLYIIFDYIEGISLHKLQQKQHEIDQYTVVKWGIELCDVLSYLHEFSPYPVIYRDMKPSNIILTGTGKIKLIDFGAAREYKEENTSDTVYIGTRGFAAPEQYGGGQTTAAADIYSLGVTLYNLLTGKCPNEPPYELIPLREIKDSFHEELERIIIKCTKQNPDERYTSAKELSAELQKLISTSSKEEASRDEKQSQNRIKIKAEKNSFKKIILTIWDNTEFACELAYNTAKMTHHEVLLADLDLLAPKVDMILNVNKYPDSLTGNGIFSESGINRVMDMADKGFISGELIKDSCVYRKELNNLHILTGSYNLNDYEYYRNESLSQFIDKAYRTFDITILAVNKFIYDSSTVISLSKSDYNILAVRSSSEIFREFNNYILFLREKQGIAHDKYRFVIYDSNEAAKLQKQELFEITGGFHIGYISHDEKREIYRNKKICYARRMNKKIIKEYSMLMECFDIIPRQSVLSRFKRKIKL